MGLHMPLQCGLATEGLLTSHHSAIGTFTYPLAGEWTGSVVSLAMPRETG